MAGSRPGSNSNIKASTFWLLLYDLHCQIFERSYEYDLIREIFCLPCMDSGVVCIQRGKVTDYLFGQAAVSAASAANSNIINSYLF